MSHCNHKSEVVTCTHVLNGTPYNCLVLADQPGEDGMVGTAFCLECDFRMRGIIEHQLPNDHPEAVAALAATVAICHECADDVGIPRYTPDGSSEWFRQVSPN